MKSRALIAAAVLLVLAGCAKSHPTAPLQAAVQRPVADTAANAVRRFVWGWAHRDTVAAAGGMTTDFIFDFAAPDSSGNPFRDRPWLLSDEMISDRHLFVGGADQPPASDIEIDVDLTLTPSPDPRPGHAWTWYQTIFTHVDLKVTVTNRDGTPSVTPIAGYALFYLVRGDSALAQPGCPRDSMHWYIDHWVDKTIASGSPGFGTLPTSNFSWGHLKALYR
jgi:hypothetical protein